MKLYTYLHQQRNERKRYCILWFGLLYGILYRGLLSDETLLWSIIITWAFFFFESRWFALVAGVYLLSTIRQYYRGTHARAEHFGVYMFWYLVAFVFSTMVEGESAHKKQL